MRRLALLLAGLLWGASALGASPPAVQGTAATTDAGATSVTAVNMPTGVVANELLVVMGAIDLNNTTGHDIGEGDGSPCNFSGANGWLPASDVMYGAPTSNVMLRAFYKVADGTEGGGTHQFCHNVPVTRQNVWIAFRVTGYGTVVDAHGADENSATTADAPSATTTVANTLVLRYAAYDHQGSITVVPGTTIGNLDSALSPKISGAAGWATQAAAGATGTATFTAAVGDQWAVATWAIAPPAVSPGRVSPTAVTGATVGLATAMPQIDWSTWDTGISHLRVTEHRLIDAWAAGYRGQNQLVLASGSVGGQSCRGCWDDPNDVPSGFGIDCGSPLFDANVWTNANDAIDGVDNDANGRIDDHYGPISGYAYRSGTDAGDRLTCQDSTLNNCNPGGTSNCAAAGATGHDETATEQAVGEHDDGVGNQVIGSAHLAKVAAFHSGGRDNLDAGDPNQLWEGGVSSWAEAHDVAVVFMPIGGAGTGPIYDPNVHVSCATRFDLTATPLDANGPDAPFYVVTFARDSSSVGGRGGYPNCFPTQPSILPLRSDLTAPPANWGLTLPVHSTCDFASVANSSTGNGSSWMFGHAGGMLGLMRQKFRNASRGEILARIVRTARKIGATPYDQPWPKGETLYPGEAWNVNQWNDQFCGGLIDIRAALETPFPEWGDTW